MDTPMHDDMMDDEVEEEVEDLDEASAVAEQENVKMLQGESVHIRTDTNQREEIRGHTGAMEGKAFEAWKPDAKARLVDHVIEHVKALGKVKGEKKNSDKPGANHAMESAFKKGKSALSEAID